jgi:ABC-type polar amino acid transport system ATPase subunit
MRYVRLVLASLIDASTPSIVSLGPGLAASTSLVSCKSVINSEEYTKGALDPTLVGEVLDLLSELAHGGTTMLIATHEMNFARDVAHQVAYLERGVLLGARHARTSVQHS